MKVKATQKFIVMSPRKLRIVADLVRELSPSEAYEKLPYVKKRAAGPLRKVIGTAIANAKQENINVEDLEFSEIQINEGPRLKRWRAGARGRAKPYKKRMSHIRIVLKTKEKSIKSTKSTTSIKGKEGKKPSKQKTLKRKGSKSRTSRRKGGKAQKKSV